MRKVHVCKYVCECWYVLKVKSVSAVTTSFCLHQSGLQVRINMFSV